MPLIECLWSSASPPPPRGEEAIYWAVFFSGIGQIKANANLLILIWTLSWKLLWKKVILQGFVFVLRACLKNAKKKKKKKKRKTPVAPAKNRLQVFSHFDVGESGGQNTQAHKRTISRTRVARGTPNIGRSSSREGFLACAWCISPESAV